MLGSTRAPTQGQTMSEVSRSSLGCQLAENNMDGNIAKILGSQGKPRDSSVHPVIQILPNCFC